MQRDGTEALACLNPAPDQTTIIPMGSAKKRPRGRPRKTESKLSTWMDAQSLTRDVVAARLKIQRTYLDKLCRAESRPSLELAFEIEKLTRGAVLASDWLAVPAHKRD
jgi:hypothetical protein